MIMYKTKGDALSEYSLPISTLDTTPSDKTKLRRDILFLQSLGFKLK